MKNRVFVYYVRKNLPDLLFLHRYLCNRKINGLKKLLLNEADTTLGEKFPERISEIVAEAEKNRPKQVEQLTLCFNDYIEKLKKNYDGAVSNNPLLTDYSKERILMIFNCLAYGFSPDEYVYYGIKNKTTEEKKQYVSDLERNMLPYILSNFKDLQYVFDKAATYEKFAKFYHRDEVSVTNQGDFETFKEFTKKHDEIVIKQVSASCGQGIFLEKVDYDDLLGQFNHILERGKCSIEERIVQSKIMSTFNATSVNTLRVMMFNTQKGITIGPCFFRTGRAGAFVDNGGAGGIFVGVDRNTGIIDSDGVDEYMNRYVMHPTSKVVYRGFQLPEWEKCMLLVKEMGKLVPRLGYIGWDLAHTDKGWVLVEANGGGQFLTQLCYGKGCKSEIEKYVVDRKDSRYDKHTHGEKCICIRHI